MRRTKIWRPVVVAAAVVALAVPAFAQVKKFKMYGAEGYDKAKEVTLDGTIETVERHSGPSGETAIHLWLKTDQEAIEVHVAPWTYLQEEGITFLANEGVTVIGARAKFEGKPVIIAREVKTSTTQIVLRDKAGKPVWEGGAVAVVPPQ